MAKYNGDKKSRSTKEDRNSDLFRDWVKELQEFQQSDLDQRENARDADRFLLEKDGQWEDNIRRQLDSQKRPRYTFDKVTPIIETMMADIEDMDFGCNVWLILGPSPSTEEIFLKRILVPSKFIF